MRVRGSILSHGIILLVFICFAGSGTAAGTPPLSPEDTIQEKILTSPTSNEEFGKADRKSIADPMRASLDSDQKAAIETIRRDDGRKVSRIPVKGIVNGSRVNVRRGSSLSGKIIHTIARMGTTVDILGEQDDWFKVRVAGLEGWIFKKLLTVEMEQEPLAVYNGKLASIGNEIIPAAFGQGFLQDNKAVSASGPVRQGKMPMAGAYASVNVDSSSKSKNKEASVHSGKKAEASRVLRLGIDIFIKLVNERNERIRAQEIEWLVSQEAVRKEKAIFEMEFTTSYRYELNRKRNTAQEFLSQTSNFLQTPPLEVNEEVNNHFSIGIEGLVTSGGRVRLAYSAKDLSNNYTANAVSILHEFPTFVGVSFTQPLLKNRGRKVTTANIRAAEADSDIAFQEYRQRSMLVVANASAAYWALLSAQEKYKARQESIRIAERILRDNRERAREGKIAESEVLEAEAGLALRKSLASAARQTLNSAINSLAVYISYSADGLESGIEATDLLAITTIEPEFNESIKKTLKLRPEYLISRIKIDKEDIRLVFAKNQRYPQLDLNLTYGLNGLHTNSGASFIEAFVDRKFETWSVGLELRIPLGGGRKSKSELVAARQRKKQALLELKAVEVAVTNAVETAVQYVRSAREQARYYTKVVDLNKRLLEVELARLEAGKSDSRLVLEKEENLNKAIDAKLESMIENKRALLELEIAEGSLLISNGIEFMEVK
ncbi:MAG: TolC family protein [Deltaproteobacteria bacterium]|nr:TolC family protein [Deltaproteobacteria bacterium]